MKRPTVNTRRVALRPLSIRPSRTIVPKQRVVGPRPDLLSRFCRTATNLFTDLVRRPEVAGLLLVAAAFTISNVLMTDEGEDLFDQLVKRLKKMPSLEVVTTFLENYKKESVTGLWFGAVYMAVPPRVTMIVLMTGIITVTIFDFSILYGAVVALGTFAFLSIKDKTVRTWLIIIGSAYTYFKFFTKGDAAFS